MSDIRDQYLALMAKAALLKDRYRTSNNKDDIMQSTSFLAEDYRLCVEQINKLIPELYKEHYANLKHTYIQGRCTLRRGHWRRNPSIRQREYEKSQRRGVFEPA